MKLLSMSPTANTQVWFNSRYWLHCQYFLLEFKGFWDKNWKSMMTIQWRYYSGNLRKICDVICPKFLWTHFFLSCWTNDVTNFPKVIKSMPSMNCHLRFSIFVPETLKFKWQCSQCLELNPTCVIHWLSSGPTFVPHIFSEYLVEIMIWHFCVSVLFSCI